MINKIRTFLDKYKKYMYKSFLWTFCSAIFVLIIIYYIAPWISNNIPYNIFSIFSCVIILDSFGVIIYEFKISTQERMELPLEHRYMSKKQMSNTITSMSQKMSEMNQLISDLKKEGQEILSQNVILNEEIKEIKKDNDTEIITQTSISFESIYDLYQIYLLIRKYNISKYQIYVNPVVADVYIKMAVYTKISINKDLLSYVNYHIDGTDVILGGNIDDNRK